MHERHFIGKEDAGEMRQHDDVDGRLLQAVWPVTLVPCYAIPFPPQHV